MICSCHLLDLDLLQLGLGVRLGLAGGAAPVAIADAARLQKVQLSSLVLGPWSDHGVDTEGTDLVGDAGIKDGVEVDVAGQSGDKLSMWNGMGVP